MSEEGGMDFLDSGVDEVASSMDVGAGGGEASGGVAPSPSPGVEAGGGPSSAPRRCHPSCRPLGCDAQVVEAGVGAALGRTYPGREAVCPYEREAGP